MQKLWYLRFYVSPALLVLNSVVCNQIIMIIGFEWLQTDFSRNFLFELLQVPNRKSFPPSKCKHSETAFRMAWACSSWTSLEFLFVRFAFENLLLLRLLLRLEENPKSLSPGQTDTQWGYRRSGRRIFQALPGQTDFQLESVTSGQTQTQKKRERKREREEGTRTEFVAVIMEFEECHWECDSPPPFAGGGYVENCSQFVRLKCSIYQFTNTDIHRYNFLSLWCLNWTHNQLQGYKFYKFYKFLQLQHKIKPARDDQESLWYLRTVQSQRTFLETKWQTKYLLQSMRRKV